MPDKDISVLDGLYAKRQAVFEEWKTAVDKRESERAAFEARTATEDDKPSDAEVIVFGEVDEAFKDTNEQLKAKLTAYDERIVDQLEIEHRRAEAAAVSDHPAVVKIEPLTYTREAGKGIGGHSYYRDLALINGPSGLTFNSDDGKARERLQRHAMEMDVELPKRSRARELLAYSKVREAERAHELSFDPFSRRSLRDNPFEVRVEPNLTQGDGGYFVPPLWLEDDYIPQLVAHLVAAGLCRQMDLPPGTDSINIPAVNQGTAVGYQQANNSGVVTQDWTDTAVQANVKTIAGESDVALQLLEQSPHGLVDEVITMNLMQQYNAFLDQQVLAGDGVNASQLNGGHLKGLYPGTNWANTNLITYTVSSPAAYTFPNVLGAMASQIARTRFNADSFKVVVHGRRAFWYLTGLDGNDRPLGETMGGGRYNIAAAMEAGMQAEGLVATLPFLFDAPLYIDDNVPTTDASDVAGAGTADVAFAALWDDLWLFQSPMRTNVYREVLSSSLGVRFQVYSYAAFLARYGQSIAIATGTGFGAPVGTTSSVLY